MVVFLIWAVVHYAYWIANPYPNEYREGAGLDIVHLMAQGINPFTLAAPPSFFYMYGFLNAWLSVAVGRVFGSESLLLLRSVSVGCGVLSSLLIAWEVHRQTRSRLLTMLAFELMSVTTWVLMEAQVRPDQLGLLLGLSALMLADRVRSAPGLILAALLTVAAFFSKQYCLLFGVEIFVFLLFVSKLRAVFFGFVMAGFLSIGVILVNRAFPCYFAMTLLAYGGGSLAIRNLVRQLIWYGFFYWPLLFFVIFTFRVLFRQARPRINVHAWRAPLFVVNPTSVVDGKTGEWTIYHVSFLVAVPALLYLGLSSGAWLSYFYQLLLPATIVVGLVALERHCPIRRRVPALALIGVFCLFHIYGIDMFTRFMTGKEKAAWNRAYALLASANGREIYFETPILAEYAIQHGSRYFDNGLTDGNKSLAHALGRPHKAVSTTARLFPAVPAMAARYQAFCDEIENGIASKRFGLIVTDKHRELKGVTLLEKNYTLAETLKLKTGEQRRVCEFWQPRE